MKRCFLLLSLMLVILGACGLSSPALANSPVKTISVSVDGLPVDFDVQPVIQDGRVLVPFRAAAEALNAVVNWKSEDNTIITTKNGTVVKLQVGSPKAICDNRQVTLDVPPTVHNGRTLVPLRFFAEAFSCKVNWHPENRAVNITSPPVEMTVLGFYALGDAATSSWTNLFGSPYPRTGRGNTDVVDELALGWYSLDPQGNLLTSSTTGWRRPEGWQDVLSAGQKYNLKCEMVVHLTDGDGKLTNLLNNPQATSRAIKQITREAAQYAGVNLDFEGLGKEGKDCFNNFVQFLHQELKKMNLSLTLSLHAPNSVYKGYDYRELGKIADRVIVMAYDYGPKPEPTQRVEEAIQMALQEVPPDKVLLGISAFSETPDSLKTKIDLAKRYDLSGIALWRLGLITGKMWNTIRNSVL